MVSKKSDSDSRVCRCHRNIVFFLLQKLRNCLWWMVQETFGNIPRAAAKLLKNQEQRPMTAQRVVHSSNYGKEQFIDIWEKKLLLYIVQSTRNYIYLKKMTAKPRRIQQKSHTAKWKLWFSNGYKFDYGLILMFEITKYDSSEFVYVYT